MQADGLKSEFRTLESSYALAWEYCPLRQHQHSGSSKASTSSSPTSKGGLGRSSAGHGHGRVVNATIATSVPPNVRSTHSQSSGLFGAPYAVPRLTLVETNSNAREGDAKQTVGAEGRQLQQLGSTYVVLNCYDMLYIMDKADPEESPVHTVNFGGICPTCHSCQQLRFTTLTPMAGDHDYAVGLATGELLSFSMRHHMEQNFRVSGKQDGRGQGALQSGGSGKGGGGGVLSSFSSSSSGQKQAGALKVKLGAVQYYNRERAHLTGRCTAISWSPRTVSNANSSSIPGNHETAETRRVLVAAFADGSLHVYSPNGSGLSSVSMSNMDPQRTPITAAQQTGAATPQESLDRGGSANNRDLVSQNSSSSTSFFSSLRRSKGGDNYHQSTGGQSDHVKDQQLGQSTPRSGNSSSTNTAGAGAAGGTFSDALLVVQWNVCDCAINSVAFSKDGYQLACVSCDGVLRIFDVGSGTLKAGCRSYFGGYLCVSWSHDGRFVVCGGEDDLVEIFSIADNALVAFGEGHTSWVSDLTFLSVTQTTTNEYNESESGGGEGGSEGEDGKDGREQQLQPQTRIYKFISVAQDTQLAFWEFEAPAELSGSLNETAYGEGSEVGPDQMGSPVRPSHRRWISTGGTNSTPISIAIPQQGNTSSSPISSSGGGAGGTGGDSNHSNHSNLDQAIDDLQQVTTKLSFEAKGATTTTTETYQHQHQQSAKDKHSLIADSVPRAHMTMIPSVVQQEAHNEPISSVLNCRDGIITLCYGGILKYWSEQKDK